MGSQDTSEKFTQVRFAFVQGRFPIFVTDAHQSPISHEVLNKRTDWWKQHFNSLSWWEFTEKHISLSLKTTRGRTNLSHLVLAPEAGVMQWRVPVFIGCISICFALDQLKEKQKQRIICKTRLVRSCLGCIQGRVLMLPTKIMGVRLACGHIPEVLRHA